MNTKGIKFLAVLAVLAMAFAACAALIDLDQNEATGTAAKTGSPLNDDALPVASAAITAGNLTFTPYLQPQTTIVSTGANAYKVYGVLKDTVDSSTGKWANVYTKFAKTLSFSLTVDADDATNHYYVYQVNDALTGDGGSKLSTLTATADATGQTGANPSFEVSAKKATVGANTVTLTLIVTNASKTIADKTAAAAVTATTEGVVDFVKYTIVFDNGATKIDDSNAVGYGFYAKIAPTTGATAENTVYYKSLDQAISSIKAASDLSADKTITVLADHTGVSFGRTATLSLTDLKTLTIDLNGKTYTTSPGSAIGGGGKNTKSLYFDNMTKLVIQNGTIKANPVNKDASALLKSFATVTELKNVTIDASAMAYDTANAQFLTTAGVKGGAAIYLAYGTLKMDDKTTVIGGENASAIVIYGFHAGSFTGSTVEMNGSAIKGDVVLATESNGTPTSASAPATLTINAGSIDGALISSTAKINSSGTPTGQAKTITINGMTVKSGETLTIEKVAGKSDTTATISAPNASATPAVAGVLTNNGTIVINGTLNSADGGSVTGTGTVDVKKGGTLDVYKSTAGPGAAHQVFCNVNIYGASTWTGYASTSASSLFTIGETAKTVYVLFKQDMSGTTIAKATFDITSDVTVNTGAWLVNDYEQVVNIKKGATVTLNVADPYTTTIGANATVTLEAGAALAAANANQKVTVAEGGKLYLADSSQLIKAIDVKNSKGTIEVKGEGGSEQKIEEKEITGSDMKIDSTTFDSGYDVIVTSTPGVKTVDLPAGKSVVINATPAANAEMKIINDNTEITVNTDAAATFSVDAGGDNKIYLEGVIGTLTFTKGSIEIDISSWKAGTIKLDDDAVVKIFGTAVANENTNLSIVMKNEGKTATLIVEKDKELSAKFTSTSYGLTIGAGIDFTVEGKMTIETGKLTVNDQLTVEGTLDAPSLVIDTTKPVDAFGTLKSTTATMAVTTTVTGGGKIVAYAASDINDVTGDYTNFSGKTASGGLWTYAEDEEVGTLTLKGYSGNYNFEQVKQNIQTIILEGENKLTYSKAFTAETKTIFGHKTTVAPMEIKTVQGTGSLEIAVNISKTTGEVLKDQSLAVFDVSTFTLDTVDLKITVSGSNDKWKAEEIRGMEIRAIKTTGAVKVDDSSVTIDVMSAYSVIDPKDDSIDGIATGIYSSGGSIAVTNTNGGAISVKTAGDAIVATNNNVTVSGAIFTLAAKTDALVTGTGKVTISNSALNISGKNGIVTTGGIDITGCALSSVTGSEFAVYGGVVATIDKPVTGDVKIRSSGIEFKGVVYVKNISASSGSLVSAEGLVTEGKLDISQASELEVKDIMLKTVATSVNNGTITITGEGVIDSTAKLTNNAILINKGTLGVYGELENVTPGMFTNDGTFNVYKQKLNFTNGTNDSFTIGADVRTDDTKAKLKSIDISAALPNADGSASVIATLDFDMKAGFTVKDGTKFVGTFAPNQDDKGYTLTLTNGSATVTVTYVDDNTSGKTKTIGDLYTVTAQGVLVDAVDETKVLYLEPNKYDKTITPTDTFVSGNLFTPGTAKLTLTSGTMVNSGTAKLFASEEAFLGENAAYEGALVTEIPAVTLNGTFTGNLGSLGTGLVTVNNTFIGNIIAKGGVTLAAEKSMTGNIVAEGNVTINGSIEGDVEILLKAPLTGKLSVSGEMEGNFIYASQYKANKDDVIDTVEFHKVGISADMVQTSGTKVFEINLAAGTNATTTASGKPGYLTFGTLEAPEVGNNVQLTLSEGFLKVPASVTIPERFELVIEKDTTIEVSLGATLDVKKAALKVSKDAVSHFETGSVGTTYGLVGCVMSFEIESGAYTIYSDVAYALTACDEGAVLTVTTSADIADNVSVKKGVNVIIDDKVTLDFKTFGLEMDEGAKITLVGTAKVVFGQTGEDKTDDTAWEFFTISGTFVFDEGKNKIVFDDVRFDAAGAELSGKAATASADSAFSVKLNYSEGEATIAAGNATGSVVLKNVNYPLAKGADDSLFSGSFTIAADTVYEGTITDMAGDATYADSVYTTTKKPTFVDVSGTFKATSGITVNGIYSGTGKIVLSDNKSITIAVGKFLDDDKTQLIAPSFTGTVRDTNLLGDEYKFALVSALPAGGADAGAQFIIKSVKDSSTQYIALNGTAYVGIIVAEDTAMLDTVTVLKNASITAETVEILKDSTVAGKVAAKELKQKSEEYPKLGKLDYDATYDVEGYTVYTVFVNIDPEMVSDITLAKSKILDGAAQSLDFSGKDVNISMAEGVTITLDNGAILTIGTPATVLGDEGSSISGIIIIRGATSYLVAYSDVDLDDAEIYSVYDKNDASKCKDAVYSILDIEDIPYAALFANENNTVRLDVADKKIVPEIEGYNFTKWCNYDGTSGADSSKIGETNAYADFKAVTVFVTVKFVTGIAYYCNGIEFAVYDTPVKVEYNSVFTAKISDTSKYQGTPLVNGKNSLVITDDVEIVGSGVTPIPEPTPEPVEENTGLSLTDILLIVLVILIAIMVVILVLRLNRS